MKKTFFARWLIWVLLVSSWQVVDGQSFFTPKVHKIVIRHIGPPAVSDDFVRANIRAKEGQSLTRNIADSDIVALKRTGYFFDVRVDFNETPDGTDVTYILQGNPILTSIVIRGNDKMSRKKLAKKLTVKEGQPLDEQKLFEDVLEMQKLY